MLTRLISDLRDISLAESGQLRLEADRTNMGELVQRKLTQAEIMAKKKDIRLNLDIKPNVPQVMVDRARIEQAIANLLANAIRHTPAGGSVTISLNAATNEANKSGLLISVSDTGEGIEPEHLPHIFERFYRVEDSRSRSEGGVGLGLAISRQMVEAHGGNIQVESERGKGSTFHIFLPLTGTT